ncbi:DUF2786 domain-containing protein [Streptomyces sp. SCUT-3]|uniref:DUF2786 domain-containing protein n=1 Tax=Streptomyces TaxID=1883 RepID=UPI0015F96E1D|nr:DUF2786 domain-containing protein [Streptomyces sp. SCUT-3]QMV22304.1 DUF2786 domain-containing protein [Streptomyces sp. SCUT-3]
MGRGRQEPRPPRTDATGDATAGTAAGDAVAEKAAAEAVETALHAVLGAAEQDLEDAVDSAASPLAAAGDRWPHVSRAVLARAEQLVDGCWRRGWQPADLVRVVRRELQPAHVRLAVDLVAAQHRRQPLPGPGPRWTAQLDELEAAVGWGDDAEFLDAAGRRESTGRFGTAGCVLRVLRLLARLPAIPPVDAPAAPGPSAPASGPSAGTASGTASGGGRIPARIRALLAKAEATEYGEEAEALTAKAQELMSRYSISEALLAAGGSGPQEVPASVRIGVDAPYEAAKASLLDAVAAANRCRTVWSPEFGFSTVVGFGTDLEAVELLHTSLLLQATTAMTRAVAGRESARRGGGRARTKDYRQSFLISYAGRIRQRLSDAAGHAVRDAAAGAAGAADGMEGGGPGASLPAERLLPVLAAREEAVEDAADRMFPSTTSHSLKGRDAEGWSDGAAAADRAELRRPRRPSGPAHPRPGAPG